MRIVIGCHELRHAKLIEAALYRHFPGVRFDVESVSAPQWAVRTDSDRTGEINAQHYFAKGYLASLTES